MAKARAWAGFAYHITGNMAACFWPRAAKIELSPVVRTELEERRAAWEKRRWSGQRGLAAVGFGGLLLGFSAMEATHGVAGLLAALGFMFGCVMLLLHSMSQSVRDKSKMRAPWAHWLKHLPARDLGSGWLEDPKTRQKLLRHEPNYDTLETLRALAPDFAGPIAELEVAARCLVAEPDLH